MKEIKSYDYESGLRFPLLPGCEQTAWRHLFDWAIAGEALNCSPGETILEFGAGTCFASEWLNRLGYYTVALDLDQEVLLCGRNRLTQDCRLNPLWASFVAGDGHRLPFANNAFDGVICLNALHHMPDYAQVLSEIRRVLKPGCKAVFSEPGSLHSESSEAKAAMRHYGAVERSIFLNEIYSLSCQAGFGRMILKPYVYPQLVDLDYCSMDLYRLGKAQVPYTRCSDIARFLEEIHSIFALVAPGQKPRTSARPGQLKAELTLLQPLPTRVYAHQEITAQVHAENTGDTLWISTARAHGGHVTLGVKLCLPDGRVISDTLGRTPLDKDVPVGSRITLHARFQLPSDLAAGDYILFLDMVDERITWFGQQGSPTIEHQLSLVN